MWGIAQRRFFLVTSTCDKRRSNTTDNAGKVCLSFLLWAADGCFLPITHRNALKTSSKKEDLKTKILAQLPQPLKFSFKSEVRGKLKSINEWSKKANC